MSLSVFSAQAPAKVNLSLSILGRRPDGYHEIESIMQTVDIFDEVSLSLRKGGIKLVCQPSLDLEEEENLAYQAAVMFFEATSIAGGVEICVRKQIPVTAGLGGGSADAAAVLSLLNRAHNYPLKPRELEDLGAAIGSDVPFAIRQGCALVKGKGEKVFSLNSSLPLTFVLVKPEETLPTRSVYLNLLPEETQSIKKTQEVIKAIFSGDLALLAHSLFNGLEPSANRLVPNIVGLKEKLISRGALNALVCGSGPSLFGLFSEAAAASRVANQFKREGLWARNAQSYPY